MPDSMLVQLLKLGGIGALAIGVVYLLFKEPIRTIAFPRLESNQAYIIILATLFAIWSIAMVGIIYFNNSSGGNQSNVKVTSEHVPRRFVYSTGSFEKSGVNWREHTGYGNVTFDFVQMGIADGYLHLVDPSRLKDGNDANRPFTIRLPLSGGMAQWSYPNPFIWQDLYVVRPEE